MPAYGGFYITGGAGTLSLTTTALQFSLWSAAGGGNLDNTYNDGDYSVYPVKASNLINCLCPGVYEYVFRLSATDDGTLSVTSQLRKNAATNITGTKHIVSHLTTVPVGHVNIGLFTLATTDNLGATSNFADPSATGYAGAGAAAKDMCPIDIMLTGSASQVLTVQEAQFYIKRIK